METGKILSEGVGGRERMRSNEKAKPRNLVARKSEVTCLFFFRREKKTLRELSIEASLLKTASFFFKSSSHSRAQAEQIKPGACVL